MFHVEHLDAIATDIQYEGHIERQKKQAEKIIRMENKTIPSDIDYEHVHALKKRGCHQAGQHTSCNYRAGLSNSRNYPGRYRPVACASAKTQQATNIIPRVFYSEISI